MKSLDTRFNDLKNNGKKIVGCFPLYPPLELFHSMGLVPITLWELKNAFNRVENSDRHLQTYACSVARHLVEFVLSQSGSALNGLFMYNACDTLRNLPEIIQCGFNESGQSLPIFKMHIPMVPHAQSASPGYISRRIHDLIYDLEHTFGVTFSLEKFQESAARYRDMRDLCKALEARVAQGMIGYGNFSRVIMENYFAPVEDQIQMLQTLLGESESLTGINPNSRVIVSGILPPSAALIETIERNRLTVVGNDIASQRRSYFYTPAVANNPADYYTDFYQYHFPCTTLLYSADRRVGTLKDLIRNTQAGGLIFVGEKFCEYEYFEIPYLEKVLREMGVPTLFLDVAIEDEDSAALITRIEAFSEIIHG
ncbi:MAG: 2-hydroxyacyl-CoA dehydratase family protein [Syntrophales bacterium]|jgi:benzoyl-CoA reductase/2-hydroxyglutaryl-CoA dehydratase subunit BcrC/BadD/HgdB